MNPIISSVFPAKSRSTLFSGNIAPISVDIPIASDTQIFSGSTSTNYDTNTRLNIGHLISNKYRAFLKFDFSSIPITAKVHSFKFSITPAATGNGSLGATINVYNVLRGVVFAQTTWNIWKTANNWGTAGCGLAGTDYTDMILGSLTHVADPTVGVAQDIYLTSSVIETFINGGLTQYAVMLKTSAENDDAVSWASSDHATPSYRPTATLMYYQG